MIINLLKRGSESENPFISTPNKITNCKQLRNESGINFRITLTMLKNQSLSNESYQIEKKKDSFISPSFTKNMKQRKQHKNSESNITVVWNPRTTQLSQTQKLTTVWKININLKTERNFLNRTYNFILFSWPWFSQTTKQWNLKS